MRGPEASFVIDGRQRVVQWSDAASIVFGVQEKAALGRPCYDVVEGCDPFGRPRCRFNCPAFRALQSGDLTGRCSFVRSSAKEGLGKRLVCELVALPGASSGAIAMVSERPRNPFRRSIDGQVASLSGFSSSSAASTLHDLVALASLTASLSFDSLEQSIERVLEWLRQATDAEIAELFLVEPQGGDMLLSAHVGPFKTAFSQMTRFHSGQGFPGLVHSHGEPISTQNLPRDPRYLRTRVKDRGFHSYVCVPLFGSKDVIGALNVAARRPDMDVEAVQRILSWAMTAFSNTLENALLKARLETAISSTGVLLDGRKSLEDLSRDMLRRLMAVGKASAGGIYILDGDVGGLTLRATEGVSGEVLCQDVRRGELLRCPALVDGHGLALQAPRYHWPAACRQVSAKGTVIHCLPLIVGDERVGVAQLRYTDARPSPPTSHLVPLLHMAEQVARVIRQARDNLHAQASFAPLQSQTQGGPWASALDRGMPDLEEGAYRHLDAPLAPPFLHIRSLGSFELYRQGKLITPEMIQRRGALTLLKILLVHRGQRVPRDLLMETLWPEADPRTGANRLYVLVHALRRAIEPSSDGHRWTYICNDGDRYYFNRESSYRFDLEEFERYAGLGQRLDRDGNSADAIAACQSAVDLYRGDFLEDEPYDEWCWEERERLREAYLGLLSKLAALHSERGALEASIGYYRQTLRVDPVREQNHQALIRVLLAAGRRPEALRQYQICRDVLRRELDVAPLPETEELYRRARSNGAP